MNEYVIVSDSTLDLSKELVDEIGVLIIPFSFTINGKSYCHYPDEREISISDFYMELRSGEMPVTSQINPAMYEDYFRDVLNSGKDLIYLGFTSGMSGSMQSANIALGVLEEEFPDRKIICIDTLCASLGEGLLVFNAAKKRDEGYSIEELEEWVITNRSNARHWFVVEDLFHLKRGGRVNAVEAVVGSALKIKPILSVDNQGKLVVKSKARGTKKALEYIITKASEEGVNIKEQTVFIGHADALERAESFRDTLIERGIINESKIVQIGPIIGTHVGTGMLALAFMGKDIN